MLEENAIQVDIEFGNGKKHSQQLVQDGTLTNPNWLGVSDVNNDGQDDLFVTGLSGGTAILIWHFEYRDGKFRSLRGMGDDYWFNHGTLGNSTGITCQERNNQAELVFVTLNSEWDSSTKKELYTGKKTVYRANGEGEFRKASEEDLTYPRSSGGWPSELAQYEGLNCPGLAYPEW
ncbi:hypothetical protein E4N62_36090 [Streptomyces sp. MNU76]|uniref:hypothetical protein n=1 Tax=Streptomyces sp. MNU76 TaxID=2560026 RepID=UPI001E4669F6|nr:hypothetical protein [Streptomyces sp. MNU76]MCC9710211.1 hypothetical protein [Streptomyces sp. MNU76]